MGGGCSPSIAMCGTIGSYYVLPVGADATGFFFFLSEDGQEWAMSPELEVDEAQRARLSEHRVPDPGQRRETGMAASCPSSGALQRWETTGLSF